jgi:hypothetical protein
MALPTPDDQPRDRDKNYAERAKVFPVRPTTAHFTEHMPGQSEGESEGQTMGLGGKAETVQKAAVTPRELAGMQVVLFPGSGAGD